MKAVVVRVPYRPRSFRIVVLTTAAVGLIERVGRAVRDGDTNSDGFRHDAERVYRSLTEQNLTYAQQAAIYLDVAGLDLCGFEELMQALDSL